MSTLPLAIVASPMFDGILVPVTHRLYTPASQYRQLVFQHPTTREIVSAALPTSLASCALGNVATVEAVSVISVRLVSPPNPKSADLMLLVNQLIAGVYQYLDGDWRYHSSLSLTVFNNSVTGQQLSTGFGNKQPFDGLVSLIRVVDKLPRQIQPYTTYVDRTTSTFYFPYANAKQIATPLSLMGVHAPNWVNQLLEGEELVICPTGHKQVQTLPERMCLTYNGSTTSTVGMPVSAYYKTKAWAFSGSGIPTEHIVNYALADNATASAEQLSLGYYRGGNNLWDTVATKQGELITSQPVQILPLSKHKVSMVNLTVASGTGGNSGELYIYVGKANAPTSGQILFTAKLTSGSPLRYVNLRLAEGETIFLKTLPAVSCYYRVTQLSRSL